MTSLIIFGILIYIIVVLLFERSSYTPEIFEQKRELAKLEHELEMKRRMADLRKKIDALPPINVKEIRSKLNLEDEEIKRPPVFKSISKPKIKDDFDIF